MLEIDKMTFTTKPDAINPHVKNVVGSIQWNGLRSVDVTENIPQSAVEWALKLQIWDEVYGELIPLIGHLKATALIHAPFSARPELDRVLNKLNALLEFPRK